MSSFAIRKVAAKIWLLSYSEVEYSRRPPKLIELQDNLKSLADRESADISFDGLCSIQTIPELTIEKLTVELDLLKSIEVEESRIWFAAKGLLEEVRELKMQFRVQIAASMAPSADAAPDEPNEEIKPDTLPPDLQVDATAQPSLPLPFPESPLLTVAGAAAVTVAVSAIQKRLDSYHYEVWYATNRERDQRTTNAFSNDIDQNGEVSYGKCSVQIPKSHKFGSLGTSWWKRWATLQFADDRLKLRSNHRFSNNSEFFSAIRTELASLEVTERQVLVYIHGYNVTFGDAALRAAQIGFDLKIPGITSFFSWPSCGTIAGYFADADRIAASEKALERFLVDISVRSGSTSVHVIAHSMGNRGFARALQRVFSETAAHSELRFGNIILAAPDMEVSLFRELACVYPPHSRRTTMYVSARDKALEMSRWLQDSERAGFTPPITVLPDIDTVEVTDIDLTALGHGYYAEADAVLRDMFDLIHFNAPPSKRARTRLVPGATPAYWRIAR